MKRFLFLLVVIAFLGGASYAVDAGGMKKDEAVSVSIGDEVNSLVPYAVKSDFGLGERTMYGARRYYVKMVYCDVGAAKLDALIKQRQRCRAPPITFKKVITDEPLN